MDFGRDIVFRGGGADGAMLARFAEAGATAVVVPAREAGLEAACRKAGLEAVRESDIDFLSWKDAAGGRPGAPAVLVEGLWPGVTRGAERGRDLEMAGASGQPWIDANGFWIGCLRAVAPRRPAVIGCRPDAQPALGSDSLELALVDAWAAGGNCLLAPDARHGEWAELRRTSEWLRLRADWFRQPALPIVTALVAPGTESAELANLMYRQCVSPLVAAAADPPAPDPERILVLVAASIGRPAAGARDRILGHAAAGACVVVDAPIEDAWWKVAGMKTEREEEDRVFHRLGKGTVVAYRKPIEDPSEFAFDVIDLVTHRRRAVRTWNASSIVPLVTRGRDGVTRLILVNYGSRRGFEFAAHVQGHYQRARMERPDGEAADLRLGRRGPLTELWIPAFRRVAVAALS